MKLKAGDRVRVIETGAIGTVIDVAIYRVSVKYDVPMVRKYQHGKATISFESFDENELEILIPETSPEWSSLWELGT